MTDETWKAIAAVCSVATPAFIFISRLVSHFEHKKTEKRVRKTDEDVMEIKLFMNGEMQKKLDDAREEGREEGRREGRNGNE